MKKSLKIKYKGSTFFYSKFIDLFLNFRKKKIRYIKKKKSYPNICKNGDKTYKLLEKLNNLKINKKVEKKIIIFYKKFEVNLSLKKSYNKDNIKISNTETSIPSYLVLGILVKKCSILNKLQKLNCILKILDIILIRNKNINLCNSHQLFNLIIYEQKLVLDLINDR